MYSTAPFGPGSAALKMRHPAACARIVGSVDFSSAART